MADSGNGFKNGHQSLITGIESIVVGEGADAEKSPADAEPAEKEKITESQHDTTHSTANGDLQNAESKEREDTRDEHGTSDSTDTESESRLLDQIMEDFGDLQ
jgi:hypothetical protein